MAERRDAPIPVEVSRLYVPKREFWTPEAAERFLADDGGLRLNRDGSPDFEQIPIPLIDDTNYPIVDIHAMNVELRNLFNTDVMYPKRYERRFVYDVPDHDSKLVEVHWSPAKDNVDHAQVQHLYFDKNGVPYDEELYRQFCNNEDRKTRLTAFGHNVRTKVFPDPPGPKTGLDRELALNHSKGHELTISLAEAAIKLMKVQRLYGGRKYAIDQQLVEPNTAIIEGIGIDKSFFEYLKKERSRQMVAFDKAMHRYISKMPKESYFAAFVPEVSGARLSRIAPILSQVATRRYWDYTPFHRGQLDELTIRRRHKNKLIRQTSRIGKKAA